MCIYVYTHTYLLDPNVHGQDSQLLQPEKINGIYKYSCILQMNSRSPVFLDPRLFWNLILTIALHMEVTKSRELNKFPLTGYNKTSGLQIYKSVKRLTSVQTPYIQVPCGLEKHTYIWVHYVVTNFLSPSLMEPRGECLQRL